MSDYTETVNLPAHRRGDRWIGLSFGPVTINGSTPAGALSRVRMQFRQDHRVFRLDSDAGTSPDAPISIDDAGNWEASVGDVGDFLPTAGEWKWDAEFYETGKNGPLTLYEGTIQIIADTTR